MKRKALILCGGWDGHEPRLITGRFKEFLESENFEVSVAEAVSVLSDKAMLSDLDLFIPVWTMCGENLPGGFFGPLLEAAASGLGVAGCHGGMCDAFRSSTDWQFLTGANWVSHPGGGVPYRIYIKSVSNPITEGIGDFDIVSEQYYLHVDPSNEVLAVTRFPTAKGYHTANGAFDMPQVWTRKWGHGRVFYNALGHHNDVFDIPEAWELMKRGMLWAADGRRIAAEKGLSAEDFKK